jgi:hypothetical protein
MGARARFVSLLAVLLVIGVSGVASGSNGDPILAGTFNTQTSTTTLSNSSTGGGGLSVLSQGDEYTLRVANTSSIASAGGISVTANSDVPTLAVVNRHARGPALSVAGRAGFSGPLFLGTSGSAIVAAGASKVVIPVPSGKKVMDSRTIAYAMLQQGRRDWVVSVFVQPRDSTITVNLARPVKRDSPVAWFFLN